MPIETEEVTESRLQINNIYSHKIILYNDAYNTFDHVEDCLIKICYKSKKEAKKIALDAHNNGKAICFDGSMEICETVAEKLSAEDLTVSVE
jgi:ATP-dependent Clp protease adaptor protein ClpS